ncbi:MAG: GDP-mannose 4,6-dehydratase [Verrucomicrobiota bacterium]
MAKHLITGGAGFIGSHLADYLIERGEDVVVIDNLSTGTYGNIEHLQGRAGFQCYIDDVRHESLVDELIRGCDRVYHLAASVGVRLIIEKPTECLINNIVGAERVLSSASRYRKPVLITSTSEVYGKCTNGRFSESDDTVMGSTEKARWGYANSKATDEFLAMAYYRETRLPVTIVRLFNTVGPRQTGQYGMVIPNFVSQALRGMPITVYGDGTQTRCFCHVKDVVPALVNLLIHPAAYGKVFNIGSDQEISIRKLAERVVEKTGSASEIRIIPYDEAYPPGFEDMQRRVPDLTRVSSLIGFKPARRLDEILQDVIEEFESQRDSVSKPRVASLRATLGQATEAEPTLKGLEHDVPKPAARGCNPVGVGNA